MNRTQKVNALLARDADDTRRLALDELDSSARTTGTWGAKEHRDARDRVERTYDDAKRRFDGLSEDQLDQELSKAVTQPPLAEPPDLEESA